VNNDNKKPNSDPAGNAGEEQDEDEAPLGVGPSGSRDRDDGSRRGQGAWEDPGAKPATSPEEEMPVGYGGDSDAELDVRQTQAVRDRANRGRDGESNP
jgi:hypothetical protein